MTKRTPKKLFKDITEKILFGKYKPAITRHNMKNVCENEGIDYDDFKNRINSQDKKLEFLKTKVPLEHLDTADRIEGRIKDYTSISHHIWVTNPATPRDMVTYRSEAQKENKYLKNKDKVCIDDYYNSFIQSLVNLEKGSVSSKLPMTEGKFYHVLWTNLSTEDVNKNKELESLRKVYGIDKSERELPEIIVLNINDVMDKEVEEVKNLANTSMELPKGLLAGLPDMKRDLISVRDVFDDMINKKMFASISDVIRIAAVKDIGGVYFDLDYVLFDQDLVHREQKKYNLFDFMKNYDVIVGKELEHDETFCNAFISSAQKNSDFTEESWKTIFRNITEPETVEYLKYSGSNHSYIICQTGPVTFTTSFAKVDKDYDIALNYGCLIYFDQFSLTASSIETNSIVGSLGYDSWGGTWVADAFRQKSYVLFDENDNGITYDEWDSMVN